MHNNSYFNILVFSPMLSHPQDAGNRIRIYNISKTLQTMGHRIHFVYFALQKASQINVIAMEKEWDSLHIIDKNINFIKNNDGNYTLDNLYQEDIGQVVKRVCYDKNIDMAICNYIFQSKLFESVPNHIFKVIDTHDIFTERNKKLETNGVNASSHWFSFSIEDEAKALNRADAVIAIQKEEAVHFRSLTKRPVIIVGHLEKCHFLKRQYKTIQKIGFIGSHNPVNKEGLMAFIDSFTASPLCQKMVLYVAGGICDDIHIKHPSIVTIGSVDMLSDFYADMDLIINPLLFGTGLKIKSVEALSYGVPIVSTQIGFEGIKSHNPLHQCEDIPAMLKAISGVDASKALSIMSQKSEQIFEQYEAKTLNELEELVAAVSAHNAKHLVIRLYHKIHQWAASLKEGT